MAYFKKGQGFIAAVYKTNIKIGSVIVPSAGKYLARDFGLDGASLIDVQLGELPSAITDFIGGNANVTSMVVPPSVSDVKAILAPVFPNIEKVYIGNGTVVVDGLDTAFAGLNVDVYVLDTLLAGYQTKYASATNLTFVAVTSTVALEIPYIEGETPTTLTADYVRQVAGDLGALASAFEKVVVPDYFTSFDANAFNMIWALFPNCGEIEYPGPRLPAEYQEVEYIESTGTQYIDSLIKSNAITDLEADVENSTGIFFGARASSANFAFGRYSTKVTFYYENTPSDYSITAERHTIKINTGGSIYIDDSLVGSRTPISVNSLNMYLFAMNNNGSAGGERMGKLRRCTIYNGETIVKNFVPCYRISDRVIGLYDTINDVFYVNQGTGVFLKGNDSDTLVPTTVSPPPP